MKREKIMYMFVAEHDEDKNEFQLIMFDGPKEFRININTDTVKCIDNFDELRPALKAIVEVINQTEKTIVDNRITEINSDAEISYQ